MKESQEKQKDESGSSERQVLVKDTWVFVEVETSPMNSMYFGDRSQFHRLLQDGKWAWNDWRDKNWKVPIDLSNCPLYGADLSSINLSSANLAGVDFTGANLDGANLGSARLISTNLSEADLSRANLHGADLSHAILDGADLSGANLTNAYLWDASLEGANLSDANLEGAFFLETNVRNALITNSHVYGVNVWSLKGQFKEQKDLIITPKGQAGPHITIDNIKIAQFIYLILNNEEVRDVINSLTAKSVLILGRFTGDGRMDVLNGLRDKLREFNLLPIVFDFDRPTDKDFTETIKTLAGLSYFVIADITNPRSSPLELQATIPDYQIPFVPIIQAGEPPFAMMVDLQKKYSWVLETLEYSSLETLLAVLEPAIIEPARVKHDELRKLKAQSPNTRTAEDYLPKGGS